MTYYRLPLPTAFAPLGMRVDVHRVLDDLLPKPAAAWEPAADAREDATGYTIAIDLPGVAPEGVDVVAEEGTLVVRGVREPAPQGDGERTALAERRTGRFERRFRLPTQADLHDVTASAAHGVLTIRVAKALPAQPRRIVVQGPAQGTAPGAAPGEGRPDAPAMA
ncbi:MAG: Hsp20/alpha crystallin family protein [Gemmatimonadetes bacterium]|nr:Hsp20/alpha crystallin family protein [Gemmatimonadota bacterium]